MQRYDQTTTDTVIFDIGNVLVKYDWETYLSSFGFTGEIYKEVRDAVFLNEDWEAGDLGLLSTAAWRQQLIENAPWRAQEIDQVFADMGKTIQPYEQTPERINYFKNKGFRLFYLSNYSAEMYRQTAEKLSFLKEFDGGVFSFQEQCMKPQEEIYRRLLTRYHINP